MRFAAAALIILLALFLAVQAVYSLQWPIAHDEAPLLYEAYSMHADGRVPYKDLFDFQMPGSFAAYYLLGRLSGFEDFRLRVLDLLILSTLSVLTYLFMQRFGKPAAVASALLFGLKYMQGGAFMALQREYLFLPFIAFALYIFLQDGLTQGRRLLVGFCFGLAAVIKPHAALALLPLLVIDIADMRQRPNMTLPKAILHSLPAFALGGSIPAMAAMLWLSLAGALKPFLDIALNYWPLYAQVNGQMEVTAGAERMLFVLKQTAALGGGALWLLPAAMGVYFTPASLKRPAYLLAGMAACFAIYPALSGQFFDYHYIPFFYFIGLLSALCLGADKKWQALAVLVLVIAADVRPSSTFIRQLNDRTLARTSDRAANIARFLNKNMQPGDSVQPLDWTGGTLLAMLETRSTLATKYVFDFYFYHHVSTPYVQSLRADFMHEMKQAMPDFIVEVTAIDKPWITGPDTSRDFPELRAFLLQNYDVVVERKDYLIYQLRR